MNAQLHWMQTSIRKVGWVPIAFFLGHVVISKGLHGYIRYPWLDIPMHFLGGVAIAYFYWRSLAMEAAEDALGSLNRFAKRSLVFVSVCASTVIWEFAEWTTDRFGLTGSQLGLEDTLFDMFLGVSGGSLLLVLQFLFARHAD